MRGSVWRFLLPIASIEEPWVVTQVALVAFIVEGMVLLSSKPRVTSGEGVPTTTTSLAVFISGFCSKNPNTPPPQYQAALWFIRVPCWTHGDLAVRERSHQTTGRKVPVEPHYRHILWPVQVTNRIKRIVSHLFMTI